MLGLCDDLRDRAISELDQMIETIEASSNDTESKTTKRMLAATDLDRDSSSPKRVKVRRENEEVSLNATPGKAPHGIGLHFLILLGRGSF
jgi:hypothetical protein